jgi:hypothetical protein
MNPALASAPAQARVGTAFGEALRADRAAFNAKFEEARRLHPDMDPRAFTAFLTTSADPVVRAVATFDSFRTSGVAHAVYDVALTLVGERLAGPGGRHPQIDESWERLLPALAPLVAEQPMQVVSAITNAVFNLCTARGARPDDWLDSMLAAAPSLPAVSDLRHAGQLAAWRAGLAHFRSGALAAGDALPSDVASAILGAHHRDWRELRGRLAHDFWWNPAVPQESPAPRIVSAAGGFRGFGGLFPEPPKVTTVDGQFIVSSGDECWHLTADVFGATFHRLDCSLLAAADPSDVRWQNNAVSLAGTSVAIPGIGQITSVAVCNQTAAVTGTLTHAVTLIALA